MLWVTCTDSQNSINAFDVNWEPWSLCRMSSPWSFGWESNAFLRVRIARSLVIPRSVMLAITLRSCRSRIAQLYHTSPFERNRYVKSVHHFWLIPVARKSCLSLFSNTLWASPCWNAGLLGRTVDFSPSMRFIYLCTVVQLYENPSRFKYTRIER